MTIYSKKWQRKIYKQRNGLAVTSEKVKGKEKYKENERNTKKVPTLFFSSVNKKCHFWLKIVSILRKRYIQTNKN